MKRILALAFVAVFAALGAEAQPLKPTPQFQTSMDLVAALRAGDVAKAMTFLADGAVLLPPGRDLISGRKAIEEALKGLVAKKLDLALVSIGSSGSAELGFDAGLFELTVKPAEGAATKSRGKYLAAFKPDAEGHWRLSYLSWNSSEAAPAAAK
jgi:ketosteroid isomerase-like protein